MIKNDPKTYRKSGTIQRKVKIVRPVCTFCGKRLNAGETHIGVWDDALNLEVCRSVDEK